MEQFYTRIFNELMKLLLLFKDFAGKMRQPAAYVMLQADISDEKYQEYVAAVDQIMEHLQQLEADGAKASQAGNVVPLYYIFKIFDMNDFEKFCFMLSFACSSEAAFRRMINLIYDDYAREYPSPELCAHILRPSMEQSMELCASFIDQEAHHRFLYDGEFQKAGNNLLKMPLTVSSRIFHFLYDVVGTEAILDALMDVQLLGNPIQEMAIHQDLVGKLENLMGTGTDAGSICVYGRKGVGKKVLISNLCRKLQLSVLFVNVKRLQFEAEKYELSQLIDTLILEALLKANAVIAFTGIEPDEENTFVQKLLWTIGHKLNFFFLTVDGEQMGKWDSASEMLAFKVEEPNFDEMVTLWEYYIGKTGMESSLELHTMANRLADQYVLTPAAIAESIQYATAKSKCEGQKVLFYDAIVEGCRTQISHAINRDATQIQTVYGMEQLVLPAVQKKRLQDAIDTVLYKNQVYNIWGFSEKMAYGRGVSMIFYGPPGTGKTMGAQVMAKELGLELYRVDLASIMSKYVGESEKKLSNIFEQGKRSQCILFFDEADSLFGKRSEVKDSQDKYANASTAFLLQKMEEYEGIIILATNFLQNFDAAFMRRFKFIIEFPFPVEEQRITIWKNVFPERAPLEPIDYEYLGTQFKLSGSQIKNVALAAMFFAAGEEADISMRHILIAIKHEMKKNGKNLLASDVGPYYDLLVDVD